MTHELPTWFQVIGLGLMLALLAVDFVLVARRPHVPSMKECTIWVSAYVALALVFAGGLWAVGGKAPATEFLAGWLTEYSLSIDNLFIFLIIMARFAVPPAEQQFVLMVGIIIALVLRGTFILAGAAVLARFEWVFYLFGAFLLWTAIKLVRDAVRGDKEEFTENAFIGWLRTRLHVTDAYEGSRLRTTVDGKRLFTPMLVVFVAIGSTDLLFAMDSIPAIFGLTRDPFLVFATNLFALMGLRQLYFLLGGLLERLVFLPYGLATILGFIGVKLVMEAAADNTVPFINGGQPLTWVPEIPILVSLGVIIVTLVVTTVASLMWSSIHDGTPRQERRTEANG